MHKGWWIGGGIFLAVVAIGAGNETKKTPPPSAAPSKPAASPTPSPAEEKKITMTVYRQLKMGMTYDQAVAVLGKPGKEQGTNKLGSIETSSYHWEAGFISGVDLMFQNGKLMQKNQFALADE